MSTSESSASPFITGMKLPEPFTLVLFGATGDLAGRKLFPSLAGLFAEGYLPGEFTIIGIGRKPKSDDEFRKEVKESAEDSVPPIFSEISVDVPPRPDSSVLETSSG